MAESLPTARPSRRKILSGLSALALSGPLAAATAATASSGVQTQVQVVSIGWHTGVAMPREAIARSGRIPEIADFPDAAFIEVGWGDRDYYMAADPSVFQALGAGIAPSPAVLHMIGMPVAPRRFFPAAEILVVPIGPVTLERLIARVDAAFDRPPGGRAAPLRSGVVRGAYFYPAHGRFHLFNTCNTWVARALSEAGLDLSASGVITADDLMARLRRVDGVRPAE